jgi:MFS superfamily sulfate permease-like transporter
LLSKPIRYGYMNGIALTVLISQLPKLFGIKVDSEGPCATFGLGPGAVRRPGHWPSFVVGAGSLALILLLKPFKRLPGILIAVVLATLAVSVFNLDQMGVKVLGQLPQGLPSFVFPGSATSTWSR